MRCQIAAALLAFLPALAFAQDAAPGKTIRLLCEGTRESGYVLEDAKKKEAATIQVTIFLPSGQFEHAGLALYAETLSEPQPRRPDRPKLIADDARTSVCDKQVACRLGVGHREKSAKFLAPDVARSGLGPQFDQRDGSD